MKRLRPRTMLVLALALGGPGCNGPSALPSSSHIEATVPSEAARVQAFIDARYKAGDVTHSFHTRFGETIDCIDFFAQPGVKALAAQGHPITTRPTAAPATALAGPLAALAFNGDADENGNRRACPDGDVPIMRITAADVARAGGLDAVEHAHPSKGFPSPPAPPSSPGAAPSSRILPLVGSAPEAHVTSQFNGSTVTAGSTNLNLFDPLMLETDGSHDIAQIWLATGTGRNSGDETCTTDCVQSVEAGFNVDPSLYLNNSPGALHFFILSTNDGYKTGCYNNDSTLGTCLAFVISPNAPFTPGQVIATDGVPAGVNDTTSLGVRMFQQWTPFGNRWVDVGWTITVGNKPIGYYPSSNYNGAMQSAATLFYVGGEVADPLDSGDIPMGNGAAPYASQPATMTNYAACTGIAQNVLTGCSSSFATPVSEVPGAYGFAAVPNGFAYGNLPAVFWGTDHGLKFSYDGDWDEGYNKGECIGGRPVDGVSKFQSGTTAHAVHCEDGGIANAGLYACYRRYVSDYDNRGVADTSEDWDAGSYKTECADDEFVSGVAQYTDGSGLHSILCCPGLALTHRACIPEVFYSGDSKYYYPGADWDPGYYKGQCPAGEYMAGISTPADPSVGAFGAPHAILCCPQ